MDRESLLDDAIAKAKETEDWQLVEWLRMARGGESAARWYTEKLQEAQAENDRLRELVRDYVNAPCTTCDCWDDNFRCWNYDGADCGLVARARELGVEP